MRYRIAATFGFVAAVLLVATAAGAATVIEPGPAPTEFRAVAGNATVALSWVPPADSRHVEVIRNGTVVASKVTATSWSTTSVRNGITYYYAVRSVDSKGRRSKPTPELAVTPLAPPPAPTGVIVRNQDSQVTVTWTRPTSSLSATVRATVDGVVAASVPASDGILVARNLVNDQSYLLTLEAANVNGTPSKPVYLTVTPTSQIQKSPFGLTPVAGDGRVDLTWLPVAGAESYELYRDWKPNQVIAGTATSTFDTGLTNTQIYRYQIRVVVSGQTSAFSPVKAATPLAVPAAPGPVSARARDTAALLSWPAPVDPVAVYELRRDGTKIADVPGADVTYTDRGLTNGTAYSYTLIGRNANQAVGPESTPVVVVPVPAPPAPAAPTATPGDDQVTLTWTATGGINRWVLLRDGARLGGVIENATSFVDTSAKSGTTYAYALIAVDANGQESAPSPSVTVTPQVVPPATPFGVRADAGDSEVTVSWHVPVPPPAKYRVLRDDVLIAETTGSSIRDAALDNGTTYRYAVVAVDARGVESAPSTTVTATPVSAGADAPTLEVEARHEEALLRFTPNATQPAVSWRVLRDGVETATTSGSQLADRSLTDGRVYRYQVQAVYADGTTSPLSAVAVAAPRAPWRAIAVGGEFACGLHVDGGVRCWGANDSRQLGDGSRALSASGPVVVAGPTAVTRIAAGPRHACAVAGDTTLWCWGAVPGVPATASGFPARVAGLTGVTAVDTGSSATCAVAAGSVWCFGVGDDGQLGGVATSSVPVRIDLPAAAVEVAVGGRHACARLADATVACWGANDRGQSSGAPSAAQAPARVAALAGISAVSAGTDHTCVLADGVASCFGAGDAGQLGRAGAPASAGPAPVDVAVAAAVSAGDRYTCVTLLSGQARCFGAGAAGQLGDGAGAGVDRTAPVAVLNLDTASVVAAGPGTTTCALTRDGSLWCFGANGYGQVGSGEGGRLSQPSRPILTLAGATQLAIGQDASCLVRESAVWCWGANRFGAAGTAPAGVPVPRPTKVLLPGGLVPRSVSVGAQTVCAVSTSSELFCWGANDVGQAGQPPSATVGVSRVALTGVSESHAGGRSTCVRKADATFWCFGRADLLGAGLTGQEPRALPTQVIAANTGTPITGVAMGAAGGRHTCAVERYSSTIPGSGRVWCFGEKGDGQLGTAGPGSFAQEIPGLVAVINISAGRAHTCAVTQSPAQTLWCFGANNAGQLGLGDTTPRSQPVAVTGMSSSKVVAGGDVTCVKSPNAQGWCFGTGSDGQTGNGLLRPAEPKAQVLYTTGGALLPTTAYATNGSTSCAALSNATVVCWGARTLTSFGDGPAFGYPSRPVVD